jgi:hypothetical protein
MQHLIAKPKTKNTPEVTPFKEGNVNTVSIKGKIFD